jgi:hypothetical protein
MHTNGSDEEGIQFDPEGAARLSRAYSYYTTNSAGIAHAGSLAGALTYSTIAYDVCFGTEVSTSTEPASLDPGLPFEVSLRGLLCGQPTAGRKNRVFPRAWSRGSDQNGAP